MTAAAENRADPAFEQGFLLGTLRIDPPAGEVTGPAGLEKLDPKVMDVLVLLAQNAGHVVLREDLLTRLWPNSVVTDDALSRCLYELRRQLALAAGDDQIKTMIETVPKRGYRLNGAVTQLLPAPAAGAVAGSKRTLAIIGAAIVVAAATWFAVARLADEPVAKSALPYADAATSIAVLPFVDLSVGQNQEHFSDGVSEEILNRLAQTRDLRVIARTSSFSFRGQSVNIRDIAEKLNVTHVLEGSVRRAGDRIRITTRLVEASSNSQLWSENYERELGDLFAIQDEIAAAVASALSIKLASAARRGVLPGNREAYELFLQGEFFYNRRAPGDVGLAAKYYQDALAIEPGYARAWASLAGVYPLLAYDGEMPREEALEKQGEAARKAIELDPQLAAGYARYSQYHWDIGDRKAGYAFWDKALALGQSYDPLILNFTAGVAMRAGDIEKAIDAQQRLVARDPLSASYRVNLGMYLLTKDRFGEAKAELRKALEFNPDLGPGVDLAIARILVLERRFEEARNAIARLPEREMRDHGTALLAHAEGRRAEADAALARLVAQSTQTPDIQLTEVYAFRGMKEQAFQELKSLQDAIDRDEPAMVSQIWSWQVELRVSPFLKPLHADPRWQQLFNEHL